MANYRQLGKKEKIFVGIYVLCFLGAAVNHLNDFRVQGWLPYQFAPIYLNFFWSSLSIIDGLAAILLITKVRTGLYFSSIVILMDLAVDIPYFFLNSEFGTGAKGIVLSQMVFAIFLFLTFPDVRKSTLKPARAEQSAAQGFGPKSGPHL